MKEVDEERILDEAEKLYALRQQMESIADKLCEKGFDNILFTSAGGSMAALEPFSVMMQKMSSIPCFTALPADLIAIGNPMVT